MNGEMPKRTPVGRIAPATVEDLGWLPQFTVVRDDDGRVFEKWSDELGTGVKAWKTVGSGEW